LAEFKGFTQTDTHNFIKRMMILVNTKPTF
jgi:hypothetical protein